MSEDRVFTCNMIGNWYCKLICLKKKQCDCYENEVKNHDVIDRVKE